MATENIRSHRTDPKEANEMIASYLSIRDYIFELIKDDTSSAATRAKKYFSSGILSFVFDKAELDKYFKDVLEGQTKLESEQRVSLRMYLAATTVGRPSLVVTLCELIGTNTDCQNLQLPSILRDEVIEHPRLALSAGTVEIETGDRQTLLDEN